MDNIIAERNLKGNRKIQMIMDFIFTYVDKIQLTNKWG